MFRLDLTGKSPIGPVMSLFSIGLKMVTQQNCAAVSVWRYVANEAMGPPFDALFPYISCICSQHYGRETYMQVHQSRVQKNVPRIICVIVEVSFKGQ